MEYFMRYFVHHSNSIPFSKKCGFVTATTKRLMTHVIDMARDILLITTLYRLVGGAARIFQWVNINNHWGSMIRF